jgi:hypothetical protein
MARVAMLATGAVARLLRSQEGIQPVISELAMSEQLELPAIPDAQVISANCTAELSDRSQGAKYPQVCVYCDKILNRLTEKFRRFSGKAIVVADVRVSQDKLDGMEQRLQLYVEAITTVLDRSRGDWGSGMFYAGGYEIAFGAARQGGKNFIQSARIVLDIDVGQD